VILLYSSYGMTGTVKSNIARKFFFPEVNPVCC